MGQLLIDSSACGTCPSLDRGEIHSICRTRTNQSRPANMHFLNRRRHLLNGADFFDHKSMRQETLIDKLHDRFVVWLKPDRSKMFSAYLHTFWIVILRPIS